MVPSWRWSLSGGVQPAERVFVQLKICFVSTYPPIQCGVAFYTQRLVRCLEGLKQPLDVSVFTDNITRNDPKYPFRIIREIARLKPSIVHFQHEYLMYGFYGVPLLFVALVLRLLRNEIVDCLRNPLFVIRAGTSRGAR